MEILRAPCPSKQEALRRFLAAGVVGLAAWLLLEAAPRGAEGAEKPRPVAVADSPSTQTQVDPRVIEILDLMQKHYQEMTSVKGSFEQVKHSEIFLEDTASQGQFWHQKPDRFRCDYKPPYESINLIVDNVAYLALPKLKQVEKYVFDDSQEARRHVHQLLLGLGVPTEALLESYEVTLLEEESKDSVVALRFVPRFEDDSGIDAIVVWVDRKRLEPKQLLIEEGEDQTRLTIKEFHWNAKDVDPKTFEPNFPKDWDVIDKI